MPSCIWFDVGIVIYSELALSIIGHVQSQKHAVTAISHFQSHIKLLCDNVKEFTGYDTSFMRMSIVRLWLRGRDPIWIPTLGCNIPSRSGSRYFLGGGPWRK